MSDYRECSDHGPLTNLYVARAGDVVKQHGRVETVTDDQLCFDNEGRKQMAKHMERLNALERGGKAGLREFDKSNGITAGHLEVVLVGNTNKYMVVDKRTGNQVLGPFGSEMEATEEMKKMLPKGIQPMGAGRAKVVSDENVRNESIAASGGIAPDELKVVLTEQNTWVVFDIKANKRLSKEFQTEVEAAEEANAMLGSLVNEEDESKGVGGDGQRMSIYRAAVRASNGVPTKPPSSSPYYHPKPTASGPIRLSEMAKEMIAASGGIVTQ